MPETRSPADFAELRAVLAELPQRDNRAMARAAEREARLTKPAGALGRLEQLSEWLCGWQGRHPPRLERVRVAVFAGWHGIAARGVSAYPAEVTGQMVANFSAGGAAINQLCRVAGAELVVRAIQPGVPTAVLSEAPAMDEAACMAAFAVGWATAEPGLDLLAVGEMGIGNTTAAAALATALFGGVAAGWVGPGTGLDGSGMARKTAAVEAAMTLHGACLTDPLEALRRVGGRELAAMAGAVLAARLARIPVLLDGYVATAAAAVLHRQRPGALDHVQAAHRSAEPAHGRLLESLGLQPLLDLGMRLGEASGAAVAIPILRAAVACHAGMATFDQARVSEPG